MPDAAAETGDASTSSIFLSSMSTTSKRQPFFVDDDIATRHRLDAKG
jgi:hypothetical protein